MMFRKKVLLICLYLVLLALCTCSRNEKRGSVVATVNGDEITLEELGARYDFDHFAGSDLEIPAAEDLQRQYGDSLASLIIYNMVEQTLAKHELAVTKEELSIAEAEAREGYPAGEFEKTLEEDAVDVGMWRRFLYHRLSMQKFLQRVLRPKIKINSEECSVYYNKYLKNFKLPPRVHFFIVKDENKAALAQSLKNYKQSRSIKELAAANSVRIREIRMRADKLSPDWARTLNDLKESEASIIKPDEEGYQFLILANKQAEKTLSLSEAYPLVEKEILEGKLEKEFDLWLKQQTESASIKVSVTLAKVWLNKASKKNKNASQKNSTGNSFVEQYEEGLPNATGTTGTTGATGTTGEQSSEPQKSEESSAKKHNLSPID